MTFLPFLHVLDRPPPTRSSTVELGLLGSVLHAELPRSVDEQQMIETSSFGTSYDPALHVGVSERAYSHINTFYSSLHPYPLRILPQSHSLLRFYRHFGLYGSV